MKSSSILLAFACLSLPLIACTDDPTADLKPIACGARGCVEGRALAAGSKMAFESIPKQVAKSARTTDASIATIAPGYTGSVATDTWTLTALAAGTSTIELLDADQDVIGTYEVTITAPDHLEATIKILQATGTTQLDRVRAEESMSVPAAATAQITVEPRAGAELLLGWREYTIEPVFTGGARITQSDTEGNATIRLATGDQVIGFKSGTLSGRFMLAAR